MINHWIEKARLHDMSIAIDDKFSAAFQKGGTLGDFFFNLTSEETEFLMNLKVTDGAMCQRGYEFCITGVNEEVEPPIDWNEVVAPKCFACGSEIDHDYVG